MKIEAWQIWIIISILLFILEIFAPFFLAVCIAIGGISAGIFSYFNFGIEIQLIAFSIGSFASFIWIRPVMLKYGHKKSDKVKTNLEALIGKVGKVIITIDYSKNQGRVVVEGDNWRAETENNDIINTGERVEILKINSTILIVKRIK